MTEQMLHDQLTPEQDKQMAERMARMSKMMQFMSSLATRSAHTLHWNSK